MFCCTKRHRARIVPSTRTTEDIEQLSLLTICVLSCRNSSTQSGKKPTMLTSTHLKSELQKPGKQRVSRSQSETQGSQVQQSSSKRNRFPKIFQVSIFQNILYDKTLSNMHKTMFQCQEDEENSHPYSRRGKGLKFI